MRLRPTQSWRLPRPFGKSRLFESSSSRADSVAPHETTTTSAGCSCSRSFSSKKATPVARPRASVRISFTWHSVRSTALPVARARGITVLCVPFLAFVSQPKPTHQRMRMQAERPCRGTLLMSSGVSKGCSPRRRAAGFRISYSRDFGSIGGIGRGFWRGPWNGFGSTSPLTPISYSAFS